MVRLQPGRLVGDEAVAEGVRLAERIVSERLDDVEQLRPELVAVTLRDAALHELLALGRDERPVLLAAGFAEVVGLFQGVPGETLCHPHHRLLIQHQPVGIPEDRLHVGMEVGEGLPPVLELRVVAVHVGCHRAWPVEGDERRDVVERGRGESPQGRAHGTAFELEHPDRLGSPQHLERALIVERDRVDVGAGARALLDQVEGHLDHREVAQAEEVHLQQAEVLDSVHLVLRNDRRLGRGLARLGLSLDGQVLGEWLVGDYDSGRMDAVLAPEIL